MEHIVPCCSVPRPSVGSVLLLLINVGLQPNIGVSHWGINWSVIAHPRVNAAPIYLMYINPTVDDDSLPIYSWLTLNPDFCNVSTSNSAKSTPLVCCRMEKKEQSLRVYLYWSESEIASRWFHRFQFNVHTESSFILQRN